MGSRVSARGMELYLGLTARTHNSVGAPLFSLVRKTVWGIAKGYVNSWRVAEYSTEQ